jgi:hypothetical protein
MGSSLIPFFRALPKLRLTLPLDDLASAVFSLVSEGLFRGIKDTARAGVASRGGEALPPVNRGPRLIDGAGITRCSVLASLLEALPSPEGSPFEFPSLSGGVTVFFNLSRLGVANCFVALGWATRGEASETVEAVDLLIIREGSLRLWIEGGQPV